MSISFWLSHGMINGCSTLFRLKWERTISFASRNCAHSKKYWIEMYTPIIVYGKYYVPICICLFIQSNLKHLREIARSVLWKIFFMDVLLSFATRRKIIYNIVMCVFFLSFGISLLGVDVVGVVGVVGIYAIHIKLLENRQTLSYFKQTISHTQSEWRLWLF